MSMKKSRARVILAIVGVLAALALIVLAHGFIDVVKQMHGG